MPSDQSLETALIHLDHDHELFRAFLDIVYISLPTSIVVELEDCEDLLALSDMLGTPGIERFI